MTVITATQYTGEEFFQGGLNQFKTQLADQLQNGIYLTECVVMLPLVDCLSTSIRYDSPLHYLLHLQECTRR